MTLLVGPKKKKIHEIISLISISTWIHLQSFIIVSKQEEKLRQMAVVIATVTFHTEESWWEENDFQVMNTIFRTINRIHTHADKAWYLNSAKIPIFEIILPKLQLSPRPSYFFSVIYPTLIKFSHTSHKVRFIW